VDYAHKPLEALRTARLELSRRHDVYTLDAYAWALCANGQYAEAQAQMQKALAVGIHESSVFYHADMIAKRQ